MCRIGSVFRAEWNPYAIHRYTSLWLRTWQSRAVLHWPRLLTDVAAGVEDINVTLQGIKQEEVPAFPGSMFRWPAVQQSSSVASCIYATTDPALCL
jgi:hypothetical protein